MFDALRKLLGAPMQMGSDLGKAVGHAISNQPQQGVMHDPVGQGLQQILGRQTKPMPSMQPQMMKMPMNAGGLLPKQPQQPGYMQQAMFNDAAGFNYPGTIHAEQEVPGYDVNYYTNPNGMYKRQTGSYPTTPYGNNNY